MRRIHTQDSPLYDWSIDSPISGELLHRCPPGLDLVHTGRTSTVQVLVQSETRLSARSQSFWFCYLKTRKRSYRKDAPYTGSSDNFRESLSTPTATFLDVCNGILFQSIQWVCVQTCFKFVALLVTEIIEGIQKFVQPLDTPMIPVLQNFNGLFFWWTLWMYPSNLRSVALSISGILPIGVFHGVANIQSAERRRTWSERVPSERALLSSYRPSIHIYQHSFARSFRLQFWPGLQNSQCWGSGGHVVGNGIVRKSAGVFQDAFHSNVRKFSNF